MHTSLFLRTVATSTASWGLPSPHSPFLDITLTGLSISRIHLFWERLPAALKLLVWPQTQKYWFPTIIITISEHTYTVYNSYENKRCPHEWYKTSGIADHENLLAKCWEYQGKPNHKNVCNPMIMFEKTWLSNTKGVIVKGILDYRKW